MPLHRIKSSGLITLSFKNKKLFIKENHHLSNERVTVFTHITTEGGVDLYPEFVFKGTGKRPPELIAECSLPMGTKRLVPVRTAP